LWKVVFQCICLNKSHNHFVAKMFVLECFFLLHHNFCLDCNYYEDLLFFLCIHIIPINGILAQKWDKMVKQGAKGCDTAKRSILYSMDRFWYSYALLYAIWSSDDQVL
jgi:hypothetical protein